MKKIIVTLIFVMFYAFSYAQDKGTPPPSETERIVDKYVDKIGDAVDKLAESLSVPAEHVYGVLVKQQMVIAYTSIGSLLIFALLIFISVSLGNKWDRDWDDWDEFSVYKLWTITFSSFFIISLLVSVLSGVPKLLNPEYGAIREILDVIKG